MGFTSSTQGPNVLKAPTTPSVLKHSPCPCGVHMCGACLHRPHEPLVGVRRVQELSESGYSGGGTTRGCCEQDNHGACGRLKNHQHWWRFLNGSKLYSSGCWSALLMCFVRLHCGEGWVGNNEARHILEGSRCLNAGLVSSSQGIRGVTMCRESWWRHRRGIARWHLIFRSEQPRCEPELTSCRTQGAMTNTCNKFSRLPHVLEMFYLRKSVATIRGG